MIKFALYFELSKSLSYVSQHNEAASHTVFDSILIGRLPYIRSTANKKDYDMVELVIKELSLEELAMRSTATLSGGEYQKVVLARALVQEPKLLILDEPTSNLDIKNQAEVMAFMKKYCKKRNISVVISIHDINLSLHYSDKFLLLDKGQVYAYGEHEVINEKSIKDVYKVEAKILEYEGRKAVLVY